MTQEDLHKLEKQGEQNPCYGGDVCTDGRFEIIEAAKQELLKKTNINTSPKEMEVLDSILFRCWQMGWLEKQDEQNPTLPKWKNKIVEINVDICNGIENWANVMLTADADNWSYHLNYDERDIHNAVTILNHVCSNVGIKNGHISEKNAYEFGMRLRQLILDMTGYDTASIADKETCAYR